MLPRFGKCIVLLWITLCLNSCGPSGDDKAEGDVVYARGFNIIKSDSREIVLTDAMNQAFTILCGETDPDEASSHDAIRAPVKKVVSTSATAVALIRAIGEIDSLAGVKLPQKAWHIKEIRKRMETGTISLIGDGSHDYIDYERVMAIRPDIVFNNMDYPAKWTTLLKDRDIQTASVCTHKEDSLLGQFEWVKMLGAFYNAGDRVKEIFDERANRYNALKERMARKATVVPGVLWGTVVRHRASVPGGASFVANAIKDSGGEYALQKELKDARGGYIPFDLELFYKKGMDADVFVLSSTKASGIKSIDDLVKLNDMFKNFKSVKNENVWCYQPWLWQSVDKPDEVFKDIVAIVHPDIFPDVEIRYFEKLSR